MRSDRDWIDIGTFLAAIAAFLAAGWAAQQAERLATATLDATAHSDSAARAQHLGTVAALQRADEANALAKATAERQAADTGKALALSKEAADAAARAVETSISAERARFFFMSGSFLRTGERDPNPKISFQIANLGKTGALVTEMVYDCEVSPPTLPTVPIYSDNGHHPAMSVIGPSATFTIQSGMECIFENKITDQDFSDLAAKRKLILLKGYIRFQDVFGQKFIKHFGVYNFGGDGGFFGMNSAAAAYNEEEKEQ